MQGNQTFLIKSPTPFLKVFFANTKRVVDIFRRTFLSFKLIRPHAL